MRAWISAVGSAVLLAVLAAAAPAQELSLSAAAGGFFPSDQAYRQIYGSGPSFAGDLWFRLRGAIGFAAGFSRLSDKGVAVPRDDGTETYPLEFKRTSIPLVAFYQFDAGPAAIRLGAGVGIHRYQETWQTVDLDFQGNKVAPRFVLAASVKVIDRISLFCSAGYESIPTRAGSALAANVNVGGFQLLGGLEFRIF